MKWRLVFALLLGGLVALMAPTLQAQAIIASCQGDPIITWTNG